MRKDSVRKSWINCLSDGIKEVNKGVHWISIKIRGKKSRKLVRWGDRSEVEKEK